jgi:hypothetical protein
VGDGLGFVSVPYQSEEFGPIVANAFTLTTIETPVSGWKGTSNPNDADPGRNIETDEDFRIRREELLRVSGSATVEAIRSDLLALDGVDQAFIFENTTLITDSNGVPGKAFESLVLTEDAFDAEQPATIASINPEDWDLDDGQTLLIKVDGAGAQTATFNTGDFSDIDNATAAEVAAVINTDIAGVTASTATDDGQTRLVIASNTDGATSSLEVTGGTANAAFGFATTPVIANGIDTLIANAIWLTKAAGIQAFGEILVPILDSQSFTHFIGLSNPEPKPVFIDITLTKDTNYPTDGDEQVKTALAAFLNALDIGADVVLERLKSEAFTVSGVRDITAFAMDFTASPVATSNLVITNRQIARGDTSDIDVSSSDFVDLP